MTAKTVYAYALPDIADPLAVFSSLYRFPYTQLLDGTSPRQKSGRYSIIVFQPVEILETWGDKVTVTNRDQQLSLKKSLPALLEDRLDVWGHGPVMNDPTLPPFQGGAVGYFGFGSGGTKQKASDIPQDAFGIYDQCVAFDHQEGRAWYIAISDNPEQARMKYAHFMRLTSCDFLPALDSIQPALSWAPMTLPGALKEDVRRMTDFIHSGSFDKSFLCQFYESDVPAGYDVLAHYTKLHAKETSPLGACQALGGLNVIVTDTQPVFSVIDGQIEVPHMSHRIVRPEGTLRDEVTARLLANDDAAMATHRKTAKEQAVRLSSLCRANGILGPSTPEVEINAGEYQITSVTRGVLSGNVTLSDLLSVFTPAPAYSGEPAPRVARVVLDMEPCCRGPAFGHTAMIGFNGSMTLNLNREVLVNNGFTLRCAVGLPVRADTDPDDWYDQMVRKAHATLSRIGDDAHEMRTAQTG